MKTTKEIIKKEAQRRFPSLGIQYVSFIQGAELAKSINRWIKPSDEYIPKDPQLKHWRTTATQQPILWKYAQRLAISEDHSDEVEWLNEN
jgi:hypothetical protein